MKHLPIPFEQRAEIIIQKGSNALCKFHTEIATSPIEHFQALLYRNELEKGSSVTFIFENPALPGYVNTKVAFAVDTIQFDEKGEITHLGTLIPTESPGIFITAFQTKHLLMVPAGAIKKLNLISANQSRLKKQKPFRIEIKQYGIDNIGWKVFVEETRKSFQKETKSELIDSFNREVGNRGWGYARSLYLHEMRCEMERRGWDISRITSKSGGFSLNRKVELRDGNVVYPL
jgi:uncharacterized membrane protein (UPF0127 family)